MPNNQKIELSHEDGCPVDSFARFIGGDFIGAYRQYRQGVSELPVTYDDSLGLWHVECPVCGYEDSVEVRD